MNIIAKNRRAGFDYELQDRYEAGLVLTGQEVKSVKTGHISLNGSFITRKGHELYLTNANIPPYKFASVTNDYDPTGSRKVLIKKSELKYLIGKLSTEGLTLVPLCVYTKKKLVKLEFAIGRGKKRFDKRSTIQKREDQRKMERALRNQ